MISAATRLLLLTSCALPVTNARGGGGPKGEAGCSAWSLSENGTFKSGSVAEGYKCSFGIKPVEDSDGDRIDGECEKAKNHGEVNWYVCRCMTKEEVAVAWYGYRSLMYILAVSFGSVSLVFSLCLTAFWQKAKECLRNYNESKRRYKSNEGWAWKCSLFFTWIWFPFAMSIATLVTLILGLVADDTAFWDSKCTKFKIN